MPQFTFKMNVGNLLMVISFLCIIFYRKRHNTGGKKFSIFNANYVSKEKSADHPGGSGHEKKNRSSDPQE